MAGKRGCRKGDKSSHYVICWQAHDVDAGDFVKMDDIECKTAKLARRRMNRLKFKHIVNRMELYRVTVTKVEEY